MRAGEPNRAPIRMSILRTLRCCARWAALAAVLPACATFVTMPQLSAAVAAVVSAAGTSSMHSTVIATGQTIVGSIVSSTVMSCVQSVLFPQASVAR